jgi:hypothetical protein
VSQDACTTCRTPIPEDYESGLCDTCESAWYGDVTIEEARLEVEDSASFWCLHLGRAEGRRCECGTVDHWRIEGPKRRGRGGPCMGVIDLDVRHKPGCPLAPPEFDWPEVDEDARERVFGYRGREHHFARLAGALREVLADREVMET